MNVLVVEDNPTDRKLMSAVLRLNGHVVCEHASAEDAMAVIATDKPDIILLDLRLPGMDGLAFTRQLKANADTRQIPIVAVTAYPDAYHRDELLAAGCAACIVKPIDTRNLANQIEAVAGKNTQ